MPAIRQSFAVTGPNHANTIACDESDPDWNSEVDAGNVGTICEQTAGIDQCHGNADDLMYSIR